MNDSPRISEAEWEVMRVVWRLKSCSAQDVIEELSESTDWGTATIKTLLNRLTRKGALGFHREGKSYIYFPACSEEECQMAEAESFLKRVFDGSLSPMLAHFVKSKALSPGELDELERLLRERKDS